MGEFKDILQRYQHGDHVTDAELKQLLEEFSAVAKSAFKFPEYVVVARAAMFEENKIRGYLKARNPNYRRAQI